MNNTSNTINGINRAKNRILKLLTMFFILLLVFVGMATAQETQEIPTEPLKFDLDKTEVVDFKSSDDFNLYLGTVSMNNTPELNRRRVVVDRLSTIRPFHIGHSPQINISLRRGKYDLGQKDD